VIKGEIEKLAPCVWKVDYGLVSIHL